MLWFIVVVMYSLTHAFLSSAVGLTIESDFYATEAGRAHFAVSATHRYRCHFFALWS